MAETQLMPFSERFDDARIMLGVLQAVEGGEARSQRHLAAKLGIALGLTNAYVKRCVRKGLMKVSEVPRRRYAYYLTPDGFAEKSRLTVEYLSYSFGFFRQARADCVSVFAQAKACGWSKVALVGISEVAEIAALCALDAEVAAVVMIDPTSERERFIGLPVLNSFEGLLEPIDGAIVCAIRDTHAVTDLAVGALGADSVLIPRLISLDPVKVRFD